MLVLLCMHLRVLFARRLSPSPPWTCLQCHTNLVAVFAELEEEPDLFGSSSSLTSLAAASAAAGNDNPDNASAAPADGSSASLADKAAPAAAPEQRVMLLRYPPRRFVRAAQRTPKLLGMVQVVSAASEWGARQSWIQVLPS